MLPSARRTAHRSRSSRRIFPPEPPRLDRCDRNWFARDQSWSSPSVAFPQKEEPLMALRKFIIERDIPNVGSLEREQLRGAAARSNAVLHQLGPDIQWVESYVAADKTFCVYLAKDE